MKKGTSLMNSGTHLIIVVRKFSVLSDQINEEYNC
jgi:hypothetical protein